MPETHTVVKGDTLWSIAKKYFGDPGKYIYLAQINNIRNPNMIAVGQVIKLTSGGKPSSTITIKHQLRPEITVFGLQANTDRTMFATWEWNRPNTKNYQVWWEYDTGNGVWFIDNKSTVEDKQAIYNAPSNAKRVRFWVKAFSHTYKVNDQDMEYWRSEWSNVVEYSFKQKPPEAPSAPTVKIEDFRLTANLDNIKTDDVPMINFQIEFQVVRDNTSVFATQKVPVRFSNASYACNITVGHTYKVRCRKYTGIEYSAWSDYTENIGTKPAAPARITVCRASSESSVYLEWGSVANCDSYEIEYATNKNYFDGSNAVSKVGNIERNHYELTGLETGQTYFFRVRAVNDKGSSSWTSLASVVIGKKPAAPTTWSSATTVVAGEALTLYWIHNAEDNSSETFAELELYINGKKESHTIQNTASGDDKDRNSFYSINTSKYNEGTTIQWRVRTAGITKQYGDWSVQRSIDIYAPPTLELDVKNVAGSSVSVITTFPFYISAFAGPKTQAPIGYHVSIVANKTYETIDYSGNTVTISKGDEVYAKHFDISSSLKIEMSAGNVDLENNVGYSVVCVVSMNSGLTATAKKDITVSWSDEGYQPSAEIGFDKNTYVTYIRPYCEVFDQKIYKVLYNSANNKYTKTNEVLPDSTTGLSVDGGFTETGETVYESTNSGSTLYFCIVTSDVGRPIKDLLLSVYRREFDGSYVEIAKDLDNTSNTYVTDPHPALDYARYRIVAVTKSTGAIGYYDLPGYPIGEKAAIIQWDEEWSNFNATSEDLLEQPPWSGSLLRLPYNIDISDSHSSDVEMVEYAGRSHPVSYYGTQLGETSTWKMEIDREDKESLYQLRRLAIWMGDAYVREPSGTGYWANVNVSISQEHCRVTMPVTLDITRVEGGA